MNWNWPAFFVFVFVAPLAILLMIGILLAWHHERAEHAEYGDDKRHGSK